MNTVKKWDSIEIAFSGPNIGNPYWDVKLSAWFEGPNGIKRYAEGFYDGDDIYRLRFMPEEEGEWTYRTNSNVETLNGREGSFLYTAPESHGPVRAVGTRFAYADGTDYQPVGTTCYVWNLQWEELEEETFRTLKDSPFNKIRFCVFPKHYVYNENEPSEYPFEGSKETKFNFTRPCPPYFRHLEKRIHQLGEMGIECDLILFHPYDNGEWGFDAMSKEEDRRYLRYIVARLASTRYIWWSLANEYDAVKAKSLVDWDDFLRIVATYDPAQHLRSIHNCWLFYDHTKKWITHVSIQNYNLQKVNDWIDEYNKPVVVDECAYEGDIPEDFGNISGEEMNNRMWIGFSRGGYVGHGETYLDPNDVLWWSKGGKLLGTSPKRIGFMRKIFAEVPGVPERPNWHYTENGFQVGKDFFLYYNDIRQRGEKYVDLPEDARYRGEIIDAWNMTIEPIESEWSGRSRILMPSRPYMALRFWRI